ncbi:Leucine-, isoleucine-, valine-, threonine-, and alanine-binding protein precursor [Pelagimonas phthalicica]|uniref:Leucine-, isoleucine-, valine-, threonine-, and alanine-binding protein n=1 Tax=Pelagimonas phthalicica TaxID=1037362 RepID=A0A238J925_9RHOB|nr:ABC transporter substrate-binding protein [Pelagimonas phthalicica]TDS94263.1 amino acid/amide ABC transporter substrate-binding protein (HAAT family) [Pelagimonas phthalicica]SMX27210.1 Leucine-, isoleucine-, valine-, threonine-, and alanine-binding protein precursor [Pelagimonas phthalicica]
MRFFLAVTLAVCASLSLAQTDVANGTVVKVGCLYPLSGAGGLYGRDSQVAIAMAQDHLAAKGGYPKLDVTVRDSRSKTLRSLLIARSFVEDDGVDFLCGVVSSAVALTVSDYARSSETFFIGTDHASPALTSTHLHPYYFRVTNGARQSMSAGAQYIAEHYAAQGLLKISFIGPDYDYGYRSYEDLRRFLDDLGVQYDVVSTYWPKLFDTDFSLYIRNIMADEPDIVVNAHWGLDLVTFVRQADRLGLFKQSQFMNFDTGGNYEILAELGSDMPAGLVLSARHHLNWPKTAANQTFVQEFHQRTGRFPSYSAEGAYSGILAIAEAVRQAGGTADKEKIKTALETLSLALPEDPDGFQSYMDPKHHQIMQAQAIGRTGPNADFPPAQMMLTDISVYFPPPQWPDFSGQ